MRTNQTKLGAIILFIFPLLMLAVFKTAPVTSAAPAMPEDPAVTYKAKCAMCHTAKADKFFDTALTDAVLVEAILKGKKGEKPPYMPAFEAKGVTADDAQALVTYMRSLRAPAN